MNNDILLNLIQTYIRAKASGELEDETFHNEKIEAYRTWLCENILDYDKLKNYSDNEFATKFGEMYDHTDGTASSHALNRGMHFKSDESRIKIRNQFENLISFINNPDNDRYELLENINSRKDLKIFGLGDHIVTSLINAKYPEVPPVNATTKTFFSNIGEPLPSNISESQRIVGDFMNNVVNLSNNELTLDDANHLFWYTKDIDSGRNFMKQNFGVTFENKLRRRSARTTHKTPKTREEILAETIAHLQAIHDQAMRDKNK